MRGGDDAKAPVVDSFGVTFKLSGGALAYLTLPINLRKAHGTRSPGQMLRELFVILAKGTRIRGKLDGDEFWLSSDEETRRNFRSSAAAQILGGDLPESWRGVTVVQFKEIFEGAPSASIGIVATPTLPVSGLGSSLRVVAISQADFDALVTKDPSTAYYIDVT